MRVQGSDAGFFSSSIPVESLETVDLAADYFTNKVQLSARLICAACKQFCHSSSVHSNAVTHLAYIVA
jgi:hypothetical protein